MRFIILDGLEILSTETLKFLFKYWVSRWNLENSQS